MYLHGARGSAGADPRGRTYAWTSVGRLIPEYNTNIITLRRCFQTVEECQGAASSTSATVSNHHSAKPAGRPATWPTNCASPSQTARRMPVRCPAGCADRANLFELLELNTTTVSQLREALPLHSTYPNQESAPQPGGGKRFFFAHLASSSERKTTVGGVLILQTLKNRVRQLDGKRCDGENRWRWAAAAASRTN